MTRPSAQVGASQEQALQVAAQRYLRAILDSDRATTKEVVEEALQAGVP